MPDAATQPAQRAQPGSQLATPRPAAAKRLDWLDALRGIAALCVVFDHLTYSVLQPIRNTVH